MQIQKQTASQMILCGIPGSMGWMLSLTFAGILLITVSLLLGWKIWQENEALFVLLPLLLGMLFGMLFIWIGIGQLREKERLVLDKETNRGTYETLSPLMITSRSIRFDLQDVECVNVTGSRVSQSPTTDMERTSAALLLIKHPRTSIVLDESKDGHTQRIRSLGQEVADFIGTRLSHHHPWPGERKT